MVKRSVFYSFHYELDNWRAAQVRNIGAIEGNRPATDNDWETVRQGGDFAIRQWIANQMKGRSCCVILVGSNTANRKWINHEIIEAWSSGKGVVGIHVHGLKDRDGNTSMKGRSPFDFIQPDSKGMRLSSIVKCYDPIGKGSQERHDWIARHLADAVEEAIWIRANA